MKILFIGDSITDMGRNRENDFTPYSYGCAYPFLIQAKLSEQSPKKYDIYNRGISGNRIVDLYARIKCDCWNIEPDVIRSSIEHWSKPYPTTDHQRPPPRQGPLALQPLYHATGFTAFLTPP